LGGVAEPRETRDHIAVKPPLGDEGQRRVHCVDKQRDKELGNYEEADADHGFFEGSNAQTPGAGEVTPGADVAFDLVAGGQHSLDRVMETTTQWWLIMMLKKK